MAISQLINNYIPQLRLHSDGINTTDVSITDKDNVKLYNLPQVKPDTPSVIEIDASGNPSFLSVASLPSSPYQLINEYPATVVQANSMCVFTGDGNFNCASSDLLKIIDDKVNINSLLEMNYNNISNVGGVNVRQVLNGVRADISVSDDNNEATISTNADNLKLVSTNQCSVSNKLNVYGETRTLTLLGEDSDYGSESSISAQGDFKISASTSGGVLELQAFDIALITPSGTVSLNTYETNLTSASNTNITANDTGLVSITGNDITLQAKNTADRGILIKNWTGAELYRLPWEEGVAGDIMKLSGDGIQAQWVAGGSGGGGNFSTPSNQALDMNYNQIYNARYLTLDDNAGSVMSFDPNFNNNGYARLNTTSNTEYSSNQSIRFKSNDRFQIGGTSESVEILIGDTRLFYLPDYVPNENQIMISGPNPNTGVGIPLYWRDSPSCVLSGRATGLSSSVVHYAGLDTSVATPAELTQQVPLNFRCKLSKFYVYLSSALTVVGSSYTFNVRINGSSVLSLTIVYPNRTSSNLIDTFSPSEGDVISVQAVPTNNPNNNLDFRWTLKCQEIP